MIDNEEERDRPLTKKEAQELREDVFSVREELIVNRKILVSINEKLNKPAKSVKVPSIGKTNSGLGQLPLALLASLLLKLLDHFFNTGDK